MFLQTLAAALADGSVPDGIAGDIAENLHGVPRLTYDIDVIPAPALPPASGRTPR